MESVRYSSDINGGGQKLVLWNILPGSSQRKYENAINILNSGQELFSKIIQASFYLFLLLPISVSLKKWD